MKPVPEATPAPETFCVTGTRDLFTVGRRITDETGTTGQIVAASAVTHTFTNGLGTWEMKVERPAGPPKNRKQRRADDAKARKHWRSAQC